MHTIHHSPYRDRKGKLRKGAAASELGPNWKPTLEGEDRVAAGIDAELDDRFTLIRNANLPLVGPIEMIVVGPTGVHAAAVHHAPGMYKAEGEQWMEYDRAQMQFTRSAENPVARARTAASHLRDLLHSRGLPIPHVGADVVMSNANTQVTLEGPAVTVVATAELARFVTTDILDRDDIMDEEDVRTAVEIIEEHTIQAEDAETGDDIGDGPAVRKAGFFGMNRRQLVVLGVMAVLDLCVLGGFAILVIRNALAG